MKKELQRDGLRRMFLASNKDQSLGLPRQWKVITSTIILLFTMGIGQMWGNETYTLVDNEGNLTGEFYATNTGTTADVTIEGKKFTKAYSMGSSLSSLGAYLNQGGNKSIEYDCKSSSVTFNIYCNGGKWTVMKLEEGASDFVSVQAESSSSSTARKITVSVTGLVKKTRFFFYAQSATGTVYQIEAVESGTHFPQPGEDGYAVSLVDTRFANYSSSAKQGYIDGMYIYNTKDCKYKNSSTSPVIKTEGTDYVRFVPKNDTKIKVKFSTSGKLYLNTNNNKTDATELTSKSEYAVSGETTYYLVPDGKDVTIDSIWFVASSCSAPTEPEITASPDASYTEDDNICLSATATGTSASTKYTWYKGAEFASATIVQAESTTATYTKNSCTTDDEGTYWCKISNGTSCDVTASLAITVAPTSSPVAPAFTSPATEPDAVTYCVGDEIDALTVVATGTPTPALKWYSNTSKSTEGATELTTGASYTPSNDAASDKYYYCVATNSAGSATSHYFHVTVRTKPAIAWVNAPANGNVGDADFVASVTTTPGEQTVSWASSVEGAATVTNGTIHYVAPGFTKISAEFTYSGSEYCEEKASIEKEIKVPIISEASGLKDKSWYYTTSKPSSSPDNGLNYASTKEGNGLKGVKLNSDGYAWFAKDAVPGTLRIGAYYSSSSTDAYEVEVYKCSSTGTKGDKIDDLSIPHVGGVSTKLNIDADVEGIYINRKTSNEGVLYFVEFIACETAITTQPSGATIEVGDANPELSIVATHATSYAWKESSDGTNYDGSSTLGSSATFTPEVNDAIQTKYYYCEVTSECAGATVVKSDIVTIEVVGAITYYTVTLVPTGGTIDDATGWTLNAGNYEKTVASGTELALPTFTKDNRTFKTWRNAVPADVASPIIVTADLTLTAIWNATVENVIYSWESDGTVSEMGGTATSTTNGGTSFDNAELNVSKADYYCIQLNGKADYSTNYVQITLSGDEKVKAGDKVRYTGFYQHDDTKNAAPKMRAADGTAIFNGSNLPNINSALPRTDTHTVPEGINTATVQLTRHQTQSSSFLTRLQILRPTLVEEANIRTVTFNYNDGGATANVIVEVESGTTVIAPANPMYAHHRFHEWQLGGVVYDFSTTVTSNITLVADWTQLYTISFANGGGSGDAPAAIADKAQGETFTVPANTFTAPEGKEFDKWNDGTSDYLPEATYTVGTANVTLTAVWKTEDPRFTVNYVDEDGTTALGSESVKTSEHPTGAGITSSRDFYAIAWKNGDVVVDLDEVSGTKDQVITLKASYVPQYATSINIEQWVLDNGKKNTEFRAVLDARYYKYSSIDDLDSLNIPKNEGDRNYPFLGQKLKAANASLSLLLQSGKTIKIRFGNVGADFKIYEGNTAYTKTSDDLANTSTSGTKVYEYTATEDIIIKIENVTNNKTLVVKQIMINEPIADVILPAIVTYDANGGTYDKTSEKYTGTPLVIGDATPADEDHLFEGWHVGTAEGDNIDATAYVPTKNVTLVANYVAKPSPFSLSALTYKIGEGEPVNVGYVEGTYEYTITLPYKASYETITVSATKVESTTTIKEGAVWEVSSLPGAATFTLIKAGGAQEQEYVVNFKKAKKAGLSVIKAIADETEQDIKAENLSGLYAEGGHVYTSSSYKLDKKRYFMIQLEDGQNFQAGDTIKINVSAVNDCNGFTLYTDIESGGDFSDEKLVLDTHDETGAAAKISAGINALELPNSYLGSNKLYVARKNDTEKYLNAGVNQVEVTRSMNPVLKSITFAGVAGTVNEGAKTVTITVPNATNLGTMEVVPTIYRNAPHATTPQTVTTNGGAWVEGDGNTYRIMDKDGDYTDYTVTITRAAVSHDATLSALTVDGNAIALENDVYTYAYEYEQGTAVSPAPVVAATAHDVSAKSVVVTQADDKKGTATVVVTAEDNETTKTYTVNFSISTKIKVVIFDGNAATQEEAWKTSPNGTTGASWARSNLSTAATTVGGYSFQMNTGGSTSASKNIAVTVPVNYQPFFELVQATNSGTNERMAFITTTANGSGTKLYELANAKNTEPTRGMSTGLTEETTYYIHSNNSINFYEVTLYLEPLAPKAATPTLSGLTDLTVCTLGTDELTVTATDLDGGTAHYQWYKVVEGDDPDTEVGSDAASYTPTEVGNYYVVVTNQKADHRDASKKSDEVTVSLKTATAITAYVNAAGALNTAKTISVTAVGDGTITYQWQACDENGDVADPAVLGTESTYAVTITSAPQYYLVSVHSDCGADQTKVLYAKEWTDVELQDVTGSMTWNWNKNQNPDAWGEITNDITVAATTVLANINSGGYPNNEHFRSDMLKLVVGDVQTKIRKGTDNGVVQGNEIMFHTTVPGIVLVTYRGTGGDANVTLTIGSETLPTYAGNMTTSKKVFVPAGDVVISSGSDAFRIQKIQFIAEADYTREVDPQYYGTICLPKAGVMVGARLFEVSYMNYQEDGVTPYKIFYDEIPSGVMEAGMPYIFLAENDKIGVFYTSDAEETAQAHKGLHGTLVDITSGLDAENIYLIYRNQVLHSTSPNSSLKMNRAYIQMNEVPGYGNPNYPAPALAPGRRRINMGVQGEQTATGFDNLVGGETPQKIMIDGTIYILRGEKLYDATGRLVK